MAGIPTTVAETASHLSREADRGADRGADREEGSADAGGEQEVGGMTATSNNAGTAPPHHDYQCAVVFSLRI
jgi:hypothetical protein